MAKIILIASGKGGTGKTTLTSNIGCALTKKNKRVLLIDTDSGFKGLDLALGVSDKVVFSFLDVIHGNTSARDAMLTTKEIPNLYLISAPYNSIGDEITIEMVAKFIETVTNKFDYILIDCSAGFSRETSLFVKFAHLGIVVATPDEISLRSADKMNDLLIDYGLTNNFLILNRLRPKLVINKYASNIDYAMDTTYLPLLGIIPEDVTIIESQNQGKSVFGNSKSQSKQAIVNITERILGKQVPIMDIK